MSPPGLSVVIPNWNGRALLEKFLPSVIQSARAFEAACGQPTEILVADDASTDDSESWLRAHFPGIRFEGGSRQQGFAPAANRGVRAARFSLVYLVNNDVALAPDTLPPLAAHFREAKVSPPPAMPMISPAAFCAAPDREGHSVAALCASTRGSLFPRLPRRCSRSSQFLPPAAPLYSIALNFWLSAD